MDSNNFKKKLLIIFCCIPVLIFFITNKQLVLNIIQIIKNISTPFIIGFTIAYILFPLFIRIKRVLNKLSNNKIKDKTADNIAIALAEIILILFIIALGFIIIPELTTSITSIIEALPETLSKTLNIIDKQIDKNNWIKELIGSNYEEMLNSTKEYITSNIKQNIDNISTYVLSSLTDIMNVVIDIIIGLFVSIFVLASRKQFAIQSKKILFAFLNKDKANLVINEVKSANNKFTGFFIGKIVDSLIIGLICLIGTLIMDMPYAGLVSFIVCITNIVPIVGPFIGAIPSSILIFSISPIKSLYFIIFIFILQQLDGNYIGPKCIGSSVKLNTFYVLLALIIFGELWGILGMIVGVPLFAVIYDILKRNVNIRLSEKGIDENDIL